MNDRQEDYLSMYRTVVLVCDANGDSFTPQSAFATSLLHLRNNVNLIMEIRQQQELEIKGITIGKEGARRALAVEAAAISAIIRAYATATKKPDLHEMVNYSETELYTLRAEALISTSTNIHTKANEHLAGLAPYGINAARVGSLAAKMDAFSQAAPSPSVARTTRKSVTQNLKILFDTVNALLTKEMDTSAKLYKLQAPEFYRVYTAARKVIPTGIRIETEGSIAGTVKIKLTGLPLEGVLIEVYNTSLTDSSDASGNYQIAKITSGVYTIRATKQGYKTYTTEKPIAANQQLTLDIEMELI